MLVTFARAYLTDGAQLAPSITPLTSSTDQE